MKMLLHARLRLSVFIALALGQELANSIPVRISPQGKEIELKEGEALSFHCNSRTLLKFVYPDSFGNSINTSNYRIYHEMENGLYNHNFYRLNTVFGDTGWYGCAHHNFHSSANSSAAEISWLYVYVKSNANVFVEADTSARLSATAGGSIVIPCRTTSKNLTPVLIKGNEDELHEASFDPKIGFTIRNLSLEDSNSYTCSQEEDGKKHTVSYILSVLKEALPEPKIQAHDLFITRGQDLNMSCTVGMKVELSADCEFNWTTPQKKSRRNIQQIVEPLDGNTVLIKSILTIFNVTNEDAGNYECVIKSIYDIKKTRKNIKIHDPRTRLITFFPEFDTPHSVKRGDFVTWRVYVSTHVEPYLQWFKPNGDEIVGNSYEGITIREKYDSNLTATIKMYSILKIISLNETDSGNYVLQAKKDYIIERINFTLNVIGKPISKLTDFRSYYTRDEKETEFRCEVISNPPPSITWAFLKYPYYPLLEGSTVLDLTNVTQSAAYNSSYIFESIAKMSIEMSGRIRCLACNKFGCNSYTGDIIVLDPVPPFFMKTNMNRTEIRTVDVITEGHNTVVLQCFADGIPTPTVSWYKDNTLLEENNQYLFKYNNQELHIKYLMLNDSGKYLCRAVSRLGINETYQQIIVKNTKWSTLDIVLFTSLPILSFILIILTFYITIKIHLEKKIKKELMEAGLINFEEGALECLNPKLRVDDQAELLPYDKKWEFPRERLKLKEQLDSGHFGVVMKAEAIGIRRKENLTTVAVKMVRRTTDPIYIRALVSELKIMVHLGKHLNVVNLLGACTKNISKCEFLVIVEYCHFGNLHNYLLRHRNDFINQINSKTGKLDFTIGMDVLTKTVDINNDSVNANSDTDKVQTYYPGTNRNSSESNFLPDCVLNSNSCQPERRSNYCDDHRDQNNLKPICTQNLLSWAFQVARGMEYLSQRKVLHGDLAARNILLAEDNVVKICDFGLAKNIYKDGNYKKKNDTPVPVKWMAIESIRDRVFSTQSDVWSFGIMLWEFFTLAKTPYPGMEVEKQYQKLIDGYRLEQPEYAIDKIYDIMLQCWVVKPTLRPSFTDLVEGIGNLLEESVRMHYIILNNPYMDINMMDMKSGKSDYLTMMSAPDHMLSSSLDNNGDKNVSLSKDTSDSSYLDMRCPTDESGIFRSRPHRDIEFALPGSVSEHAIEKTSTSEHEEALYLKPINVYEQRAEFVRQRQATKNQIVDRVTDQNSVYCNAPQNSLDKAERHEPE